MGSEAAATSVVLKMVTDDDSKLDEDCVPTTVSGNNGTSAPVLASTVRRRCWNEAFESESCSDPDVGDDLLEEKCSNSGEAMPSDETDSRKSVADDSKIEARRYACEAHPGCLKSFSSGKELEEHHNLRHFHKCSVCKKSLPSAHILELHVLEAHDTLFSLMAERKPMMRCFLESCPESFWKSEDRKDHCLAAHSFPKAFPLWNLVQAQIKGPKKNHRTNRDCNGKGTKADNLNLKSEKSKLLAVAGDCLMQIDQSGSRENLDGDAILVDKTSQGKGKKHSQKQNRNSASKQQTKQPPVPSHFTFGHSAGLVFKPKYSFAMKKEVSVRITDCKDQGMDLDLSEIREVLPSTSE